MATFLLTWNPKRWHWTNLHVEAVQCQQDGYFHGRWSCGNNRSIQPRDRLFLLRQGKEPRGILASGRATSSVFQDAHWDEERQSHITAYYVNICFDTLLDPEKHSIFPRTLLSGAPLDQVHWGTLMSGIHIPDEPAQYLEEQWLHFIAGYHQDRAIEDPYRSF